MTSRKTSLDVSSGLPFPRYAEVASDLFHYRRRLHIGMDYVENKEDVDILIRFAIFADDLWRQEFSDFL
uniref:Uncharacterized protein n=1 Tax=Cucumis sativus TaxID=3659 RepID=A0A0A0LAC5_CUCSA